MNPFRFEAGGKTFALPPLTNRKVREIREACGVDVRLALTDPQTNATLILDQDAALDWVWKVVGPQHPGMTFEQFTDDLTGEDVERVLTTAWGWLADFFRQSRIGWLIRTKGAAEAARQMNEAISSVAADPSRLQTLIDSRTSSPAPSASTPTSGASAS